jgi:hypothetical protein
MSDARQRARAVAMATFEGHGSGVGLMRELFVVAIEAYFDERTRHPCCEAAETALATMRDNRDMARVEADAFRARVAELEAVVRAADAMNDCALEAVNVLCESAHYCCGHGGATEATCSQVECRAMARLRIADEAFDAARAKIEVPRG